jgi:hypothetical protein
VARRHAQQVGLATEDGDDRELVQGLLDVIHAGRADYTLTFRRLCAAAADPREDAGVRALFAEPAPLTPGRRAGACGSPENRTRPPNARAPCVASPRSSLRAIIASSRRSPLRSVTISSRSPGCRGFARQLRVRFGSGAVPKYRRAFESSFPPWRLSIFVATPSPTANLEGAAPSAPHHDAASQVLLAQLGA